MCGYVKDQNKSSRKTRKGVLVGAGVLAATVATVVLAACSPQHSTALHADVKSSGVQNAAQVEKQRLGIPSSSLGQIEYAHNLLTPAGRHAVEIKAGIPAKNRQAFEAAVLGAAESGHLGNAGNRTTFLEVTLPALALKYQN